MTTPPSRELLAALEAAAQAERIVMRHFGRELATRLKDDGSPVTQADLEAEAAIIATLRRHFPDYGFLAEESGASGNGDRPMWVVDPIDGTASFIRGIPLFSTQIALTRGGVPVLGVSSIPGMGETLFAETGQGAFLGNQRLKVSDVDALSGAQVSFGGLNYFLKYGRTQAMLDLTESAGRSRAFGDAYAYHLLATGRSEIVAEAHIRFWDIAALTVIIHEAGGKCSDFAGRPIGVDTADVVCTNGRLHPVVLDVIAGRQNTP
jgi:histidinol-phosphatase